ncbi:MAG: hypothetical protein ABFS45_11725 [Pseudomonadota bacterium]
MAIRLLVVTRNILLVLIVSLVYACSSRGDPQSSVTVLVDLSGSWLTNKDRLRNERLLKTIGEALIELTDWLSYPIIYRYLPIGTQSFAAKPLCKVEYNPTILSPGKKRLRQFLVQQCPKVVVTRNRQNLTDISGAISSFAESVLYGDYKTKLLIILSDLREEVNKSQTVKLPQLLNTRVILVYRVLPIDQNNYEKLKARIADWHHRLEAAGAEVRAVNDRYITPAQLQDVILR